ncbi:hypothetical protein ACFWY9_16150 [Amycolatopsis sp. NPDC059027]|uniref:hypothetical protein n=1 Tax=unclassified Amycolatopsis TaxID=2618356 RepID=UPI003672CEFB
MTITAIRLVVAGDVLLGTGALMAIAEPSGHGVNFGAIGFLFFGQCVTGAGLLLGVVATLAWLPGRRDDRQPPAQLLAWEKRLRGLTTAAVGLITIGAAVLGAGPLFIQGAPGSGFENDIPIFLVGLGVSAAGLLTGTPPALYWLSKRRTGVDR